MGSGLSIPRVFFGGEHRLEDVIEAASCIDASVFTKTVLEEGFGIESEIKSTWLGVVPNHHYVELADGSVIDPIIGGKRNPGGFFKSKEVFEKRLEAINSGGTSIIIKQIKNIINPPEGSSKNGESVSSLVEPSTSPSI